MVDIKQPPPICFVITYKHPLNTVSYYVMPKRNLFSVLLIYLPFWKSICLCTFVMNVSPKLELHYLGEKSFNSNSLLHTHVF